MADVDYDALATKYGGKDAPKVDYDALAEKYGASQGEQSTIGRVGSAMAHAAQRKARQTIGTGEAAAQFLTGAVAAPVAGIAGLAQGAKNLVSPGMDAADRVRQVQEAMTYEPRTEEGQAASDVVNYLPGKLGEIADKAGGAVTDLTGSPAAGAAANTLIQAAPALIAKVARPVVRGAMTRSAAELQKAKALNAPQDAALQLAKDNDISVSPSQGNGGIIGRAAEGIAGEPKLQKVLSKGNAPKVEDMVRQDVGLPEGTPVTRETLAQARSDAHPAYEAIKDVGEVSTDAMYKRSLADISRNYDTAAKSFSHRSENPFKKTFEGLDVDKFDTASAIEEVKLLRQDADEAYANRKSALGRAYRDAAQAVDDQLDRAMTARIMNGGDPALADAVAKYRAARQQIAKTYTAEKALNADGSINPAVYARELRKGKPLSGKGKELAQIASAFPRAVQPVERLGSTGPTYFDAAAGLISHEAPLLFARPATRAALASPAYQHFLGPRSYKPGAFLKLSDSVTSDPALLTQIAAQGQQQR